MSEEPRAYTANELRDLLLRRMHDIAREWAQIERDTVLERIKGALFSTLVLLDGGQLGFPGFDLVAKPHETDKQFCIDNGENWIEPDTVISCQLYEHFYRKEL